MKTLISLCGSVHQCSLICVCRELWVTKDPKILKVDTEDSNQPVWICASVQSDLCLQGTMLVIKDPKNLKVDSGHRSACVDLCISVI